MTNRLLLSSFAIMFTCSSAWPQQENKSGTADENKTKLSAVSPSAGIIKIPEPKRQKAEVFVMKELLKDIPQTARAEFIGSFMLKDGRIATLNTESLKKTMDKPGIIEILNSLGSSREAVKQAKKRKTAGPARVVVLSELFKDIPVEARNHFFENMMFKDGGVACVDATELKKAANKRQLITILNSLAPAGGKRPEIYSKVLCGDGWCEESICSYTGGKWHCRFNENQDTMCYDWCEDLP